MILVFFSARRTRLRPHRFSWRNVRLERIAKLSLNQAPGIGKAAQSFLLVWARASETGTVQIRNVFLLLFVPKKAPLSLPACAPGREIKGG